MKAFRWGLGAVLGMVALASAALALRTYVDHRLWLGALSIVVLAIMDVVGLLSLWSARQRLDAEMRGLVQAPPAGSLWDERRRTLQAIRTAGHSPDVDALAHASATREAGRAYLGRYFVAVTVLVGLVGTFAGLMETLRAVAPMLQDPTLSATQLVAAPLAGLDVTFGASIVGILVTLALSLVQGDLVLAEEETLALLEERTVHVLVPELWPTHQDSGERTVRELLSLREGLTLSLDRMSDATATRVAAVATSEVQRLVGEVQKALAATVNTTAKEMRAGAMGLAGALEERLAPVLKEEAVRHAEVRAAVERAAEEASRALSASAAKAQEDMSRAAAAVGTSLATSEGLARKQVEALGERTEALVRSAHEGFHKLADEHARSVKAQGDAVQSSAQASLERMTTATERAVAASERVASVMTEASARAADLDAARMAGLEKNLAALSERARDGLAALADVASAKLGDAQSASVAATHSAVEKLAKVGEDVVRSLERAAERSAKSHEALVEDAHGRHASLEAALAESAQRAQTAMNGVVEAHAHRLQLATDALLAVIESTMTATGTHLGSAGTELAAAAGSLRDGAATLAPVVTTLGPELGALSRELALLAARVDAAQEQTAVIDELARLGEGVDRLETLLRMTNEARG